ncbi:spermidine/putrescine ABC transporter membrane protein [Enhygromyxa salina]|uniref:Spermidine/putrescine ABC transporter membrane protein n=1 Tax=Enhygromyxa salina TaxID=215803 RepID=A0A2S9YWW6_9BACT|nr:spermidine/putrescine ABC transporter membrane protein [Enhygromyxa salina]
MWLGLVVLLPLGLLVDAAWPFELREIERVAVGRVLVRGLGLSLIVAIVSGGLGLLLAQTVAPVVLLALLLVSRSVVAHAVLAIGFTPGPLAAVITLIIDVLPFAALVLGLRLRTRPLALIEAARDLGAGALARAREIEWPHLRPAMLVACTWGFLQGLGDVLAFEVAGGGHAYTPGLLIRDALIREHAPARALVCVVVLISLALPCAWLITRELTAAQRSDWRPVPVPPAWVRAAGWAVLALLLVAPAALLLGDHPVGVGPSDRLLAGLFLRSLGIAGVVAALATSAGFGLALASRRLANPAWLGAAVLAPLAIPPSIHGLLTLGAGTWLGLSPGPTLTVLALLGPALALGFVTARLMTVVIPRALIDAAIDLGATARERLRLVWLPLARPALIVAAVLTLAWALGQAAIPAFTSGPGGDTLAVALTIHARAGSLALVRRWSLLLVLVPVLAALAARQLARWRPR